MIVRSMKDKRPNLEACRWQACRHTPPVIVFGNMTYFAQLFTKRLRVETRSNCAGVGCLGGLPEKKKANFYSATE